MLHSDVEKGNDVHDLAATLIQQAERCAHAGLIDQATAILAQAWTIAHTAAPELADQAAWQVAWIALHRNDFNEAAAWFERVRTPPPIQRDWHAMRATLIRVLRQTPVPSAPHRSSLPPLQVVSFGRFAIIRDGVELPACPARKAIAILRYLLTRRFYAASKEELMELLWPEASPAKAGHNLQVSISTLRQYLDSDHGSYILWENGTYRLAPAAVISDDRGRFQHLCDRADHAWTTDQLDQACELYAEAISCYVGDYYLDDADGMWAVAERERLLTRYLVALERLGNLQQAQSPLAATACYLRLIEHDPYREDVYRQLMRCFWRMGRRGDALRQYQRLATTLRDDLGLEPDTETQSLLHQLQSA